MKRKSSSSKFPPFKKRPLVAERLEDRVLLSADPFAALDHLPDLQDFHQTPDALQNLIHQALHIDHPPVAATDPDALHIDKPPVNQSVEKASASKTTLISADDTQLAPESNPLPQRHEVVFVDSNITNYQDLIKDLQHKPETLLQIVVLDHSKDGLQQITDTLNQTTNPVDAIHIFSHGSNAQLNIAQTHLNPETLKDHAQELQSWQTHLTKDADILIYGCNVTAQETGVEFVKKLSELTQTDIAASSNDTAPEKLGGDFILETTIGVIETHSLETTADIILATPAPTVALTGLGDHFLNESFDFNLVFDNPSSTNTGYGPYVDLVVPREVVLGSPKYLTYDLPKVLIKEVGVWNGSNWVTSLGATGTIVADHPYEPAGGTYFTPPSGAGHKTGDKWIVFQLPFGSFVPEQPTLTVTFAGNTLNYNDNGALGFTHDGSARYNLPLTFDVIGGYRFGSDPLDNPSSDAPIKASQVAGVVTPKVIELTKTNDAPEGETATGKNFPRTFTITVDVANQVTVTNLAIDDFLDTKYRYLGDLTITTAASGAVITYQPDINFPLTTLDLHKNDGDVFVDGNTYAPSNAIFDSPDTNPDNKLRVTIPSVVGTTGSSEIIITYKAYVPEYDGTPQPFNGTTIPILNPNSSGKWNDWNDSTNVAQGIADYSDDRGTYHFSSSSADALPNATSTITDKPLAIQKGVSAVGGPVTDGSGNLLILPGVTLEYVLDFQVSDYFAFNDITITDVFSDGQRLNTAFQPVLHIESGNPLSSGFVPVDYTLDFSLGVHTTAPVNDSSAGELSGTGDSFRWNVWNDTGSAAKGDTTLVFDVSSKLASADPSHLGRLIGAQKDANSIGSDTYSSTGLYLAQYYPKGTTGKITYQTVIQEQFSDLYQISNAADGTYTNDKSVDTLDKLGNNVSISGNMLDPHNSYASLSDRRGDISGAGVEIAAPKLVKSIYAIDGQTVYGVPPRLQPGQTVTYRLTLPMPSADSENFVLTDYLPLPVFDMSSAGYTIVDTSLDATLAANFYTGGTIPAAGHVGFGPLDNFHNLYSLNSTTFTVTDQNFNLSTGPIISVDSTNNLVKFDFGKFDTKGADAFGRTLDLLITVKATDHPFATDNFFLTNQAQAGYGNTQNNAASSTNIVQILLVQPNVHISKGTVATTNINNTFIPGIAGMNTFADPSATGSNFTGFIDTNTIKSDLTTTSTASGAQTDNINSNVTNVDAKDVVRFAITLENQGDGEAHDLVVDDTIPQGLKITESGLDIAVTKGDGSTVLGWRAEIYTDNHTYFVKSSDAAHYTDSTGGVHNWTAFSYNDVSLYDSTTDATGFRIIIDDPATSGALGIGIDATAKLDGSLDGTVKVDPNASLPIDGTSAKNVAVISYELKVPENTSAGKDYTNEARIVNYAGKEGGHNLLYYDGTSHLVDGTGAFIPPDGTDKMMTPPIVQNGVTLASWLDKSTVGVKIPDVVKDFASVSAAGAYTDQTFTTGSNVVIGEGVYYDIAVTLAEGTNQNLHIIDLVPDGLRFDPTFNSNKGYQIITDKTVPIFQGKNLAKDFNGDTLNPTITTALTTNVNDNGKDIDFSFGNVYVTPDNDTSNNAFVMRVKMIATDVTLNQDGSKLVNNVAVTYKDPDTNLDTTSDTANSQTLVIKEPTLTITKSALSSTTLDAGDAITYSVVIKNSSSVPAFDISFKDAVMSEIVDVTLDSASANASVTWDGSDSFKFTDNTLQIVDGSNVDLYPTGEITLIFHGKLSPTIPSNIQISNTAQVWWTSIDGTNNPDERTGADVQNPQTTIDPNILNNYGLSSTVVNAVINNIQVNKTLVTTNQPDTTGNNLAIGEIATYRLDVTLPEGVVSDLRISDNIPLGMALIPESVSLVSTAIVGNGLIADFNGSALSFSTLGTFNNGGDVTFDFNPITITSDNDSSNNAFYLTYQTKVLHDATTNFGDSITHQTALDNTAAHNNGGATAALTFTPSSVHAVVVEPSLTITKNIANPVYDATDLVTMSFVVSNVGLAKAYEVHVEDTLDINKFVEGSFVLISPLSNGFTSHFEPTTGKLEFGGGTLDFTGANSSITFNFALPLEATVAAGETITNYAFVTTSTLPGNDANERQEPTVAATDSLIISEYLLDGTVYKDLNNDGTINGLDSGISGVAVTLTGFDHLNNPITFVTTTNASGYYKFEHLRPSDTNGYTLLEVQPTLYLDGKETTGNFGGTYDNLHNSNVIEKIILSLDQTIATTTATSYNFGELPPNTIIGKVWNDKNNDGIIDSGETGISGIEITLTGNNDWGSTLIITTTDANGFYTFTDLRPTDSNGYTISETQPVGFLDGRDVKHTSTLGTVGNDYFTALIFNGNNATGQTVTGYDFGEVKPNALSGIVWEDRNNDGIKDSGEPVIEGATVILSGVYKNSLGNDATYDLTAITNVDGSYQFTSFYPSTNGYTLTEILPATYLDGKDATGTINGSAGGTITSTQGATLDVFVFNTHFSSDAKTGINYNFGEIKANVLTGFVFEDDNNDGSFNSGAENGISGVVLTLTGTNDLGQAITPVLATTDSNGKYDFTGLRPSDSNGYIITETHPTAYLDGKEFIGDFGGTAQSPTFDVISKITLTTTDSTAHNYNFGELKPNVLIGQVWNDKNNDGTVNDGGTAGISGVVLTLEGTSDIGLITYTATTSSDGFYTFDRIRPSVSGYTLTETQPPNFIDGKDNITGWGSPINIITGNDYVTGITFLTGQTAQTYNFGEIKASQLIGNVWHDLNNDGTFDSGETGISGVVLTLTGTNDYGAISPITSTTDSNGHYTFSNLRPGSYQLTETQPPNFIDGKDATQDISIAGFNYSPEWTTGHDVISQITIGTDQTAQYYNFGEILPSKLTGFVYEDLNNNGVKETGETGISGVVLTLTGTNDFGVGITETATTDSLGKYDFTGLRPSDSNGYQIKETQPAGYYDGSEQIGELNGNLSGSAESSSLDIIHFTSTVYFDATNYNFGELPPNEIHGIVWTDKNNDGLIAGIDEIGISGVTVSLEGTDYLGQTTLITFVTGNDGSFHFTNLPAGHYKLIEQNEPTKYLDGKDAVGSPSYGFVGKDGGLDAILDISLDHTAGAILTNYRFGEIIPVPISGYVWNDQNNDGSFDQLNEPAISGTVITLIGTNDLTAFSLDKTTDSNGYYEFPDLRPGTYTLTEHQSAGFLDGKDRVFDSTARATSYSEIGSGIYTADWTTGHDQFASITLNENTPPQLFFDFGELRPSKLTGEVWHDANNDASIDTGETHISGVILTLSGIADDIGATTYTFTTNTDGKYTFDQLRPGNYNLVEPSLTTFMDGRDQTGEHARNNTTISGGILTTVSEVDNFAVSLTEGMTASGYNFGEIKPSTFSGKVWEDLDNNGTINGGETGISGVVLTLTGTVPNETAEFTFLTTTDSNGLYTFTNLPPASYKLIEPTPTNYIDNKDQIGTINGVTSGSISSDHTNLSPSFKDTLLFTIATDDSTALNYNFGEIKPFHLNGVVYHDLNNDGSFDSGSGETGISGVILTLTGTNDVGNAVSLSITTDSTGFYQFDNLRPSNTLGYSVKETQPANYIDGKDTAGTFNGTTDGSARVISLSTLDLISNITFPIDNLTGETAINYNFGEIKSSILQGTVWEDDNTNGVIDSGEPLLSGVVITLTGTNDQNQPVNLIITTDSNGHYSFGHLRPSDSNGYKLVETQPTYLKDGSVFVGSEGGNNSITNTISQITLNQGVDGSNYNFSEKPSAVLGDTVYFDKNADGIQQPANGEYGLANVPVTVTWAGLDGTIGTGDDVSYITTTDASGNYWVSDLPKGYYEITLDQSQLPVGLTVEKEKHPSATLSAGETLLSIDFGFIESSTIGDTVYKDLNEDGTQNFDASGNPTEPGIGGVSVLARWAGSDGIFGNADDAVYSTNTDSSGHYLFTNVPSGKYQVSVNMNTVPADYKVPGEVPPEISVDFGGTNLNADFGFKKTPILNTAQIGDTVWLDANGDGSQQSGETGIAGVYIELYRDYNGNGKIDANEPIYARATTDASGHYTFASLFADQYIVKVVDDYHKLDNLTLTTSNEPHVVSLAAKEVYRNADFGYKPISPTGSAGDFVWFDANKDGIQNAGETGIANVVVKLTYAGADGQFGTGDDTLFIQTTDSQGKYQFTALPVGKYSIVVDSASVPPTLSAVIGGQSLGQNPYAFSLAQAQSRQDLDFGYKSNASASLGDFVWLDADKDGVQDAGETGIANVPVKLTFAGADGSFGTADDVTQTTTTNASGHYQFNNLAAGKYKVDVTQPANTSPTSGAQSVGGNSVEISLANNQSNQT
ncbi:MAG: hypothetical protein RIT27_1188, partial [Pseudomonadota bacterium]